MTLKTIPHHSKCLQPYNPNSHIYVKDWVQAPEKLSTTIVTAVWSPILFRGGRRKSENFMYADWLVLDFDDGELSLDQAIHNQFCDSFHVIGTTKSHQKIKGTQGACDRFRVCLLFEERITDYETFKHNMRHYTKLYGADMQCQDLARQYYPCQEIKSVLYEEGLETVEVLKPPPKVVRPWDGRTKKLPTYLMPYLSGSPITEGFRDKTAFVIAKDLLKAAYAPEQIVLILERLNFQPQFPRDYLEAKVRAAVNHLTSEIRRRA